MTAAAAAAGAAAAACASSFTLALRESAGRQDEHKYAQECCVSPFLNESAHNTLLKRFSIEGEGQEERAVKIYYIAGANATEK